MVAVLYEIDGYTRFNTVKKEANTNEIANLNVLKISKKVLDNRNGPM